MIVKYAALPLLLSCVIGLSGIVSGHADENEVADALRIEELIAEEFRVGVEDVAEGQAAADGTALQTVVKETAPEAAEPVPVVEEPVAAEEPAVSEEPTVIGDGAAAAEPPAPDVAAGRPVDVSDPLPEPLPVPGDASVAELRRQLEEANMEVARLKDVVRRIVVANRRERVSMHYNVACVFKAGQMYGKAEQEFIKALRLAPEDSAVHFNLGILYEDDLKDLKKARKHYERFLVLAPNDADAARVREWLTALD